MSKQQYLASVLSVQGTVKSNSGMHISEQSEGGTFLTLLQQCCAGIVFKVVKHALQIRNLTEGASKIKLKQCKTQDKIEKYNILPQ